MLWPSYLNESVIEQHVHRAWEEDVGSGDISAALCGKSASRALLLAREPGIFCGGPWVDILLKCYAPQVLCRWLVEEGSIIEANQPLFEWEGPSDALLTLERTALNFLQTLSGTATLTSRWVKKIAHTQTQLLDTRKTLPGLRLAQKYAVYCGGGVNHRIGLFDAILIKENHIRAMGSISNALKKALTQTVFIEIEVETLTQLEEALSFPIHRILLDNFSPTLIQEAVKITAGKIPLEASGNIQENTLITYAETGVNYLSCGALTKNVKALDLSLRFY